MPGPSEIRWRRQNSHCWGLSHEGYRCVALFACGPAIVQPDDRPVRLEVTRDGRELRDAVSYANIDSWRKEGRRLLSDVIQRETRRPRRRGTAA